MNAEAETVLRIFSEISRIPRKSGNRVPMKDWLVAWAERKGFRTAVDSEMNVVVYVPGSPGREDDPAIALQAHTDMVCESAAGVDHDFARDPIEIIRDGDWLTAKGTSLGADNGIGLAMALACAEDPDLSRPPLEIVATVDEEIGLLGAVGMDVSLVGSRRLVNLDGETEGEIVIGCAGVAVRVISVPGRPVPPVGDRAVRLSVSGFQGGHSAADVDKGRGNAVAELVRGLLDVRDDISIELSSLEGGTAFNAIPREAGALVIVPEGDLAKLDMAWNRFGEILQGEYGGDEPAVACVFENAELPETGFDRESTDRILGFLVAVPDGLLSVDRSDRMSPETSSNLGIVKTSGDAVQAEILIRGIVDSRKSAVARRLDAVARLAGGRIIRQKEVDAWNPHAGSPLQTACLRIWKDLSGADGIPKMILGGVECGVLANRIPGLDTVSLGADIEDLHSPGERVSIPSVGKVFDFLRILLEQPA